ncbi:7713_t:CDS:2 [Racocetra fulgida]|uniref:7713_t:CDS:1 n=1 Tax=Racocetra fulgida TaxID=60492 RepID=A0A9N9A4W1_9GLOM|nr:7713_t:CDS:2 [Racocetra fulgida]
MTTAQVDQKGDKLIGRKTLPLLNIFLRDVVKIIITNELVPYEFAIF